jgi:signal transduction histidine kinase
MGSLGSDQSTLSSSPLEVITVVPSVSVNGHARLSGESGLRRLAGNLAHNINNTLTGVVGHLELALRETRPGTSLHEHLQRSLSCAHRIAEMVRRIVAFAFQPSGHGTLIPLTLRHLAEHIVRELRPVPGTTISIQPESDGRIRSSQPLLLLVLDQLVSNSLEAMPQGGTLAIRIWEDSPCCCLSITDTGQGMSAAVQAQLFQPFFTTKCSGHLGLGLALCRDVLEALGGGIQIASVEGQGTTVTVAFPAAEHACAEGLPIDERLGQLVSCRANHPSGPHFPRSPVPAVSAPSRSARAAG